MKNNFEKGKSDCILKITAFAGNSTKTADNLTKGKSGILRLKHSLGRRSEALPGNTQKARALPNDITKKNS